MAAIKILLIIGTVAGIIIIVNTILRNGSEGVSGLFPAAADKTEQNGRPLETVPNLIETRP